MCIKFQLLELEQFDVGVFMRKEPGSDIEASGINNHVHAAALPPS